MSLLKKLKGLEFETSLNYIRIPSFIVIVFEKGGREKVEKIEKERGREREREGYRKGEKGKGREGGERGRER